MTVSELEGAERGPRGLCSTVVKSFPSASLWGWPLREPFATPGEGCWPRKISPS